MKITFKNVLLVYKKSAYSIYFMERKIALNRGDKPDLKREVKRFKKAHDEHYGTLRQAERLLRHYGINYIKRSRGSKINYGRYDLIITLGGDGTFMEVARSVRDQVIIGVNSAPGFSVGKLCVGNIKNLERIIRQLINQKGALNLWPRLRLTLDGHTRPVDCVNDCLIAHSNPAAMSRYYLKIGSKKEEQRNSGLWVATAAGSSGAIKSAGGRALKLGEKVIQYRPRELYYGFSKKYKLTGHVLRQRPQLEVTSLMRSGKIFVDGTHIQLRFPFNAKLKISLSPNPIKTIKLN